MRKEWALTTLESLCIVKPSKAEAKKRLHESDLVSFIPMKDLGVCSKKIVINEEKALKEVYGRYTYFANNDVLLAKITPCFENGKLGVASELTNGIGFGSSEYIVLRSNGNILPEYLFYFLSQDCIRIAGAKTMTGSVGHKRVTKEFINNLKISIPPTDTEQKRIVKILDKVFAGIEIAIANTEKNLQNARELFDSELNSIFQNKGEDWEEKKLGELCEKVEYGSSAKSKPNGDVPVIRMGNVQDREIDWKSLVYSDDEFEIEKYFLRKNDVLFNRTNSPELVGKTAIYRGERPAIFAGYLIRIHNDKKLLDSEFLNYYLSGKVAREYGESVMTSSVNQANINGTKLKQYPLLVPNIKMQKQIVSKLNSLRSQVKKLEQQYTRKLECLAELKQAILQKAFTGELTREYRADVGLQVVE